MISLILSILNAVRISKTIVRSILLIEGDKAVMAQQKSMIIKNNSSTADSNMSNNNNISGYVANSVTEISVGFNEATTAVFCSE